MNAKALNRWGDFVERERRAWKAPGVAVAVFSPNDIVFMKGFGRRRLDKPATVASRTPFCIGSTTKAFTALSLAQLVDDGRLDWDAPVRDYMPEFALRDDASSRLMTARDLLTHRSGLPRHDTVWFGNGEPRAEMMKRLRHLQPNKTFRQAYQYQNLMFMAAGHLVERIAGSSWEDAVRERIFAPLGMKASGFSFDGDLKSPERGHGHNTIKGKTRLLPWKPIDAAAPAGAITSTLEDMIPWVRLHMVGDKMKGKHSIVSKKLLKELHTPIIAVPDSDTYSELFYSSYAMGWHVRFYRGAKLLGHGGLVNGFSTYVCFLPDDGIGVVAFVNLGGSPLPLILAYNALDRWLCLKPIDWNPRFRKEQADLKREKKKKLRERQKQRVSRTSPTLPLDSYCGEYENPGYGSMVVRKQGGGLRSIHNNVESKWTHYHYDMFVINEMAYDTDYLVSCFVDAKGRAGVISIPYEENADPIIFTRVE